MLRSSTRVLGLAAIRVNRRLGVLYIWHVNMAGTVSIARHAGSCYRVACLKSARQTVISSLPRDGRDLSPASSVRVRPGTLCVPRFLGREPIAATRKTGSICLDAEQRACKGKQDQNITSQLPFASCGV